MTKATKAKMKKVIIIGMLLVMFLFGWLALLLTASTEFTYELSKSDRRPAPPFAARCSFEISSQTDIEYFVSKPELGCKKVDVFYLPGGPGADVRMWEFAAISKMFPRLNVAFVNPLGTGSSSDPLSYDQILLENTNAVEKLITSIHDKPTILLGSSWGATFATELATRGTVKIERLVLLNPGPLPIATSDCAPDFAATEKFCFKLERKSIARILEKLTGLENTVALFSFFKGRTNEGDREYSHKQKRIYSKLYPLNVRALISTKRQFFARPQLQFKSMPRLPVLIIYGQFDKITENERKGYSILFRNFKSVKVIGKPHEIPFDNCIVALPVAQFVENATESPKLLSCENELKPINAERTQFVNSVKFRWTSP